MSRKTVSTFSRLIAPLFLPAIFLYLFFAGDSAARAEVSKKPAALVDQPLYDFGTISEGSKVQHDFVLRNGGEADLAIQRVVAACGCTAAASAAQVIPPGGQTSIHVEFNSAGFAGQKTKTVRVFTSDPNNPSTLLTLRGTIQSDVTIEPSSVYYGEVSQSALKDGIAREVAVRVRSGSGVSLGKIVSVSSAVEVTELSSSPSEKRLSVRLKPAPVVGEIRDRIVIALAGGARASVNIPVYVSVRGDLAFEPAVVSVGVMEGAQPIVREVKIVNRGEKVLELPTLVSSDPAVKAEVREKQPGRLYLVRLEIDPRSVKGDLRATVEARTTNTDQPNLTLNVFGVLPPKG